MLRLQNELIKTVRSYACTYVRAYVYYAFPSRTMQLHTAGNDHLYFASFQSLKHSSDCRPYAMMKFTIMASVQVYVPVYVRMYGRTNVRTEQCTHIESYPQVEHLLHLSHVR